MLYWDLRVPGLTHTHTLDMNIDGNYERSFVHFNDISSSNSYQKQLLLVETLVSRGLVLAPLAHILCAQLELSQTSP